MSVSKINCVIVNYNDAGKTSALVESIQNYRCLQQIVVVDNASTDDSLMQLSMLAGEKVTILEAAANGGYGAGNNYGVRYSIENNGADYVIIANPDVAFTESCVGKLAKVLDRYPDVGVVAAAMTDPHYRSKPSGWRLHGFVGELLSMGPVSRRLFRGFLEYPEAYFARQPLVAVEAVHGSMLMIRGNAFLACGGYDEAMFLYQEEAVLGQRMKQAGYRTAMLTRVSYRHEHAASIGKAYQAQAARQQLRHDSTMYYFKHYLKINKVQEFLARAWFRGIMAEIWLWEKICGSLMK